jgi:NADPH-dependent 2,4-dienoyl-CoA reductase/sulfur reductase-like enzyme
MKSAVALSVCSAAIVLAQGGFDPARYASSDVITRDVAIIGGGSSGTYSAMYLQKGGKSVVVVEKEEVLGGNTHTWTDPSTGISINYGLEAYQNSEFLLVPWNMQRKETNSCRFGYA